MVLIDASEIAKSGGKHSGFYKKHVKRDIESLEKQVKEHQRQNKEPNKYIENFNDLDPRQQEVLISMNIHDEMSKVLDTLSRLNEKSKKEILTQQEIREQEENLLEFKEVVHKMHEKVNKLRSTDSKDVKSVNDLFRELHFLFDKYLWQIDEIHTLVKKMVGNYRDCNQ